MSRQYNIYRRRKTAGGILALCCLLTVHVLHAGETDSSRTRHYLSLQTGINQLRDELLLPKVSTGTVTRLNYGFERNRNFLSQFSLHMGYSRLRNTYEDVSKTVNLEFHSRYGLGILAASAAKLRMYIGPEAGVTYNATYFPNWDESHLYWASYITLGVKGNLVMNLKNRTEWVSSLSLPVVSAFSRPPRYRDYKIDDLDAGGVIRQLNSHYRAGLWNRLFNMRFSTAYRFPAGRRRLESVYYTFEYLYAQNHNDGAYFQIVQQLGIKIYL